MILEDLLNPLENEDPTWHARFIIYVDIVKSEPIGMSNALKKVYELAPTPGGKMPHSWFEKAKEFQWEKRAHQYLVERSKEKLQREREKILEENDKNLADVLKLEYSERYKRIKASSKLSDSFITYANVLEEAAKKYSGDWVEQLTDIKTHSSILKQVGDAIAKVASYQPTEFEAGKAGNTENETLNCTIHTT